VTARRRAAIVLAALAGLTLIRLAVAALAPLAPDEAYYWIFSRALAPGYLDHPPMVALWICAGTTLAGQGALGVRLLGPLSGALGSLLLYDAAARLWPDRPTAGLTAVACFNATLLAGIGAVIMTPDTPLLFFWTATLWAVARLLSSGRGPWWLAIGLLAGLALASKYTAALLWLGIGLWLLATPTQRRWWRSPWPWLGAALGAAAFLPVVLWNAAHGWASFLRQGGRVGDWQPARAAQFLGELVGGQLGLATPLLAVLLVAAIVWLSRRAWTERDPTASLLVAMTLPGVAVFVQHAFGDRVQGNWPAILYPAAALGVPALDTPRWLRLRAPAVWLGAGMTLVVYLQAGTGLLPIPPRLDPIDRQLGGWPAFAGAVNAARVAQAAGFVASDEYGVAAELARSLPRGVMVLGVDPRWRLFRLAALPAGSGTGILLSRLNDPAPPGWRGAVRVGEVDRASQGVAVERFAVWRVSGALASLPAAELPRWTPGAP
jgi:4-amino-4-deoxy-L-arabinose transferase-like glycosyltransferase